MFGKIKIPFCCVLFSLICMAKQRKWLLKKNPMAKRVIIFMEILIFNAQSVVCVAKVTIMYFFLREIYSWEATMCFSFFPVYGVDCNVFCAYLVSTCGKFCGVDCVLFPGGFFVYLFGIFIWPIKKSFFLRTNEK